MIYLLWFSAAENLTLPYLTPYLDSVGANYRHGANFATGGSCIRPTVACFSQFHLGTQVSQFIHFKTRTLSLYNQTYGKFNRLSHTNYQTLGINTSLKHVLLWKLCWNFVFGLRKNYILQRSPCTAQRFLKSSLYIRYRPERSRDWVPKHDRGTTQSNYTHNHRKLYHFLKSKHLNYRYAYRRSL